MVVVVDDLVTWLIGRLADAGYKKLTTWLRGSDQQRALKKAVTSAVQATVREIGPSGGEEADRAAEQINKAFRRREPVPLPPGQATLLEALQAGIAGQLSAVDDAGQPAAGLLGVPVSEVAAKLTGHLVRQIQIRGSQPGPLTPLADQLNHDLTQLRGQRLEGMLAQVLNLLGHELAPPVGAAGPAGWPLAEVRDPFALEVHHPVEPDIPQPGLPVLPVYMPRKHDAALAEIVTAAAAGASGIAVLVGGSSTGKTRACWEALEPLRRAGEWRLWHPVDPQAALAQLPGAGPRTVVWLNEAQRYLGPAGGAGERVAAGLRELLSDRARGPVLVLATLWPQFWHGLTARRASGDDPHAQARELLAGHDITVPAAFTQAQLQRLSQAGDARLAQAAAGAQDGQVIQFLAGAPELLARYRNAPPAAAALIRAAMDARRLGMGIGLPEAFLEAAAPGYLTDAEWDALGEDWLEQALAYTKVPCKGVRGPLTCIRPRPASSRAAGSGSRYSDEQLAGGQADIAGGPLYRLADYLDQHGRAHRKNQIPPAGFWAAAAGHTFPGDQAALGDAADARGLYRDAAQLHKNAAACGNLDAVLYLSDPPHCLRADVRPVRWAVAHVSLDDPRAVTSLLNRLRALEQVTALLHRDPAAHVSLDDPGAVAGLLDRLRAFGALEQVTALADRAAARIPLDDPGAVAGLLDRLRAFGALEQVTALLHRDPAAHVSLDHPGAVARLLDSLRAFGALEQVTALLHRDPAAHVSLDHPGAVARLLDRLRAFGALEQVTALADRAAAHIPLNDPNAVAELLDSLRRAGALEQITALADHAAAHIPLNDPGAVARLLDRLREFGALEQVTALADRAAAHIPLNDPNAVAELLDSLRRAGALEQITALLHRDPAAHVSLDDLLAVAVLLGSLWEAGEQEQVTALADRAAARIPLDDPGAVADLLDSLRWADALEQITALLHRDPAAHVSLDDPVAVARLLDRLREAGEQGQAAALADRAAARIPLDHPAAVADLLGDLWEAGALEQITALADHAAAHVFLDDPGAVFSLLYTLREVDAQEQAIALADRLPEAGMFELFCEQEGHRDRFRFGREADGSPAEPWGWEDLD